MSEQYIKILSRPEARHRYWHISKDDREFFPETDVLFKMKFDGKVHELKVNHKNDIMTGKLYERFRFLEGNKVLVKKMKKETYILEAPDTKLYPGV